MIIIIRFICWLAGWLVGLLYSVSTILELIKAKLSQSDKSFKQFSLVQV